MSAPSAPEPSSPPPALEARDLSVTALYTAQTWVWGGFEEASRFESDQSRAVFGATNLALALFKVFNWGRPSLHKGLTQRHALIDQRARELQPTEVVELAAGLSARGLRLSSEGGGVPSIQRYLEVDLPHVIQHKRALYQRSERGASLPRGLNWRGLNVTRVELGSLFERARGGEERRLLIAEGLMMYLDADMQRGLWREALEALKGGGVLLFDLVPSCEQPPPGLLGRALGALMSLFTGGKTFITDERGREELICELRDLGFVEVRLYETSSVARERGLPHPEAKTQQLIFEARAP